MLKQKVIAGIIMTVAVNDDNQRIINGVVPNASFTAEVPNAVEERWDMLTYST